MSPTPTIPFADNNLDVDSDPEAEQAALELALAQERVRTAQEAQEKRWEERRRQEEDRKAKIMVTFKLAAEQAAELVVEREQRVQLQVSCGSFSLDFNWKLTSVVFFLAGFGGVGHDTGTIARPLY